MKDEISAEIALRETVTADLRHGGVLSESLPGYEERSAQVIMARRVADALEGGEHLVVEAGTGTGKALDVDTPIPTPTGWKRMGDLAVGDIIFDEAGYPTHVLAAFETLYDRTCYEVLFSDGSKIVADAEHQWVSYTCANRKWLGRGSMGSGSIKNFVTPSLLDSLQQLIIESQDCDTLSASEAETLLGGHSWTVGEVARGISRVNPGNRPARFRRRSLLVGIQRRLVRDLAGQRREGRRHSIVTTEQLANTLSAGSTKRANHAIQVAGALSLPEADLPIAPYFLGAWLGDGSSRNNQITSADPEILTEIEKDGYTVRPLTGNRYLYAVDDENGKAVSRWQPGMTGRLRQLGLMLNKQIPSIYLRASEAQRIDLLAGLLDTDGTVSKDGAIQFSTTSQRLADDSYELVCSLGFRPYIVCGRATLNGKDCGPKWTIAFTTNKTVFRLPRKVEAQRLRLSNFTPRRNSFRYVVAVNEVQSRPVRCIQVDAPSHLYLAGKSMIPTHNSIAYLLPIVRSGKVAVVSTANKALQEQLFYKDIPFIQEHVMPFEAALVKGMGNYLCLDRLTEEQAFQQIVQSPAFASMERLLGDFDEWNGDLDLLTESLPKDIRGRVAADSDFCAWRECPYFGPCYVREMRDRSRRAQIIVVNHTLLLLDAAMEGFLLPERDVIVIDEAHHLEEEATRAFTITVSPGRVTSLLAQRRLREHTDPRVFQEAQGAFSQAWDALERVARPDAKGRQHLTQPLEDGLHLASVIDSVATSLQRERPLSLDDKEEQLYEKLVKRTRSLASDLRAVFGVADPANRVYYLERTGGNRRRDSQLSASAAPLSVATLLREKLFDRIPTIATSATLAVNRSFNFFRSRVGIPPGGQDVVLPLTFDYASQALLYVPRLKFEPAFGAASGPYLAEMADEMRQLVEASDGRAFLLFSSFNALDGVLQRIGDTLEDDSYTVLVQGRDMGRIELLRQFRERPRAVLFGLKSFWEGVDVVGEALSLVVIDKLPFDPPDDPVNEARVNQMKAAGENWFGGYTLPQAILRLKQGLGRLLRSHEDRGVLAILDKRLHTKSYGRDVLAALPPAQRTINIADVQRFFSNDSETDDIR